MCVANARINISPDSLPCYSCVHRHAVLTHDVALCVSKRSAQGGHAHNLTLTFPAMSHSCNERRALGKTLQTISLLGYLHEYRGIHGTAHDHRAQEHAAQLDERVQAKWCPILRATKFHW